MYGFKGVIFVFVAMFAFVAIFMGVPVLCHYNNVAVDKHMAQDPKIKVIGPQMYSYGNGVYYVGLWESTTEHFVQFKTTHTDIVHTTEMYDNHGGFSGYLITCDRTLAGEEPAVTLAEQP